MRGAEEEKERTSSFNGCEVQMNSGEGARDWGAGGWEKQATFAKIRASADQDAP